MDADDYSAPTRLEEQLQALDAHAAVRCVGTFVWEFRDDPKVVDVMKSRPIDHAGIRRAALCGSGMIHGSIVIHREAMLDIGAYDERYRFASDRDMFIRFLDRYQAMNIPKLLIGIRRHPKQDSFSLRAAEEYLEICERLSSAAGRPPEELAILRESLAFCYLFRARCHRVKRHYDRWGKDTFRAMQISPALWMRNTAGAIGSRILPKRRHMSLRVNGGWR
jgi:hypothetical protein